MSTEDNRTSACCGDVPRLELPEEYKPKGTTKKTPKGLSYYESIPDGGSKHPEIAVVVYYDVSEFFSLTTSASSIDSLT